MLTGRVLILLTMWAAPAAPLAAQSNEASATRPGQALELSVGHASFVDESPVGHLVVGGGWRVYVMPRLSLGPEIVWMRGPGSDRDLLLTGNVMYDFRGPGPGGRQVRVAPFVVGGGGLFQHAERFGPTRFSTQEGGFTAGGGARIRITDRVYAAGDVRTGWEPHIRIAGTIGITLGH